MGPAVFENALLVLVLVHVRVMPHDVGCSVCMSAEDVDRPSPPWLPTLMPSASAATRGRAQADNTLVQAMSDDRAYMQ